MATQTTQQKLEAANTLEEFVELLGGEENVVLMLQRAIKAKEASRVAHKKNYLRKQLVLKDPRVQALMKDLKVED